MSARLLIQGCTSCRLHCRAGGAGPLDLLSRVAPQLRSLSVSASLLDDDDEPMFISLGASLPTSMTSLAVSGLVEGLGPYFSQLERLEWCPKDRHPWVSFPAEEIHGLGQVGKLGGGLKLMLSKACIQSTAVIAPVVE